MYCLWATGSVYQIAFFIFITMAWSYLSEDFLGAAKVEEGRAVEVVDALLDGFVDDFDVIFDGDSAENGAQLRAT